MRHRLYYIWIRYLPWGPAHLRAATYLYCESERWFTRAAIVGKDYANEMFLKSRIEQRIYKKRVLKNPGLLLRVIFTPYSV